MHAHHDLELRKVACFIGWICEERVDWKLKWQEIASDRGTSFPGRALI